MIQSIPTVNLFYLLSGETRESFHPGIEVNTTVINIRKGQGLTVRLDNNMIGTIGRGEFSDNSRDFDNIEGRVNIVMVYLNWSLDLSPSLPL